MVGVERAQVSVEYMAVMAMALAIFAVVWLFTTSSASQADGGASIASAKQAVGKLKDAADLVYTQGPPAQVTVPISVPRGTVLFNASGREVVMIIGSQAGNSTAYAVTYGNLSAHGLVEAGNSFGPLVVVVAAVRKGPDVIVQMNASS